MKLSVCLLAMVAVFYAACVKKPDRITVDKVSINSIAPSSGRAGTKVVIKGAYFGVDPSDNIVKFNNDSAAVIASFIDSLIVIAPANGKTGPVTVTVAGSTATGPVFTYITDSTHVTDSSHVADSSQVTDSVDVYVAAPAMGVVYWKNGQEVFLASTQGNTGGAYGIAVSDTDVYVGGYTHFSIYPSFEAALWKNGNKITLSSPDSAGEVRALVLSGNDLYAGGSENYRPVYWKNGVKYSLPMFGNGYARVNAMAVNGSDVYAAGYEAGPNNEERSVFWKNGVETVLGTQGMVDIGATSVTTNGSDVYVCAMDSGQAVYWKNGVRVVLEKFSSGIPVSAHAIAIANNSIYVMGSYGGDAVYWKDGTRITLPKRGYSAIASAISFYKSDIYMGGMDGSSPMYWKNGVETQLCCSQGGFVSSIAIVKKR